MAWTGRIEVMQMASSHARCRGIMFLFLSAFVLVVVPFPVVNAQSPPVVNNVSWRPTPVTPNDTFSIYVNVTSAVGVRNVTLYYRVGPSGLKLSSSSDYTRVQMDGPAPGNSTNGIWWHDFRPQPNGTVISCLVEAFDLKNTPSEIWPGNYPPFENPFQIMVRSPSKPYMSYVYFTMNSLMMSDLGQQSNVTIDAGGYLPKIPELWYGFPVEVVSNGPYRYRFPFFWMQNHGERFYYSGQSSGWIDLRGSPGQLPYDTYTISIDTTFPYRFENLTYISSTASVELFGSFDIRNSWEFQNTKVVWIPAGNATVLRMESTLKRRIPTYYPPLVLMLVAFSLLGLIPLVSVYHHDKRYDLFLNVIILASSAELSEAVSPALGFRGDNIFLESFALILAAAVIMMAISSLPENIRSKAFRGFQLEFFTTLGIVAAATTLIFTTNFPMTAKQIVPIAGSSGAILTFFYMRLPDWLPTFRDRLGLCRSRVKKWIHDHATRGPTDSSSCVHASLKYRADGSLTASQKAQTVSSPPPKTGSKSRTQNLLSKQGTPPPRKARVVRSKH